MSSGNDESRQVLRTLSEKHGSKRAVEIFMNAKTLDQALQDGNASEEVERLKTRIAKEKQLLAADRGETRLTSGERMALGANDRIGLNLDEHHPDKEVRRLRSELASVFEKRDEALAENNRLEHQRRLLGNR